MTILSLISDILLVIATLGLAAYCVVLSKRLRAFSSLDEGMGSNISALSEQVDRLHASLSEAQAKAATEKDEIVQAVADAEEKIGRLEVLLASLEDVEGDILDHPFEHHEADAPDQVPSFRATRSAEPRWPAE